MASSWMIEVKSLVLPSIEKYMRNQIKKMRCLICNKALGLTKHTKLNLIFCSKLCRDQHNKEMAYNSLETNEQLMVRSLT